MKLLFEKNKCSNYFCSIYIYIYYLPTYTYSSGRAIFLHFVTLEKNGSDMYITIK